MKGFTEFRKLIAMALSREYPGLEFRIRDFKYDADAGTVFFTGRIYGENLLAEIQELPDDALFVEAALRGLDLEKITDDEHGYKLYDYVPGRKKPYKVRARNGKIFAVGTPFVEKVFKKRIEH